MKEVLRSEWGRLFLNWEKLTPDERGWPTVGPFPARAFPRGTQLLRTAAGVLGTCLAEAPETKRRPRPST